MKQVEDVNNLDKGADKLKSGIAKLYDATGKLESATGKLHTGVGSLYNGAAELNSGLNKLTTKNNELTSAAMSAYEALCKAAQNGLNAKLTANGLKTVILTPENYSKVLMGVMAQMDADKVYNKAYNAALKEVNAQVETQADTLYTGYIESKADEIYQKYIRSQADALYVKAAGETAARQLIERGYNKEQAAAYLETNEGKTLVTGAVSEMTDAQKEQVINTAVQSLTAEQKKQILNGAAALLTDNEKTKIKDAYIKQQMAGEKVTSEINRAVQKVSKSVA